MPNVNLYYKVKIDTRAWEGPKAIHKRGWIFVNEQIHVVEEYGGALRFDTSGHSGILVETNYNEAWVVASDVANLEKLGGPIPPPQPNQPAIEFSDAGKALYILVAFIKQSLR